MPRHNSGVDEFLDGHSNVRKRVCSSSSSTSSMLKNYRIKRTVLVAKRGGSTTPVPLWRMNARSPRSAPGYADQPVRGGTRETQLAVSARKLANALWELNNTPSSKIVKGRQERKLTMGTKRRDMTSRSVGVGSLSHHLSNSSCSPISELCNQSRLSSQMRMVPSIHQKFQCKEHNRITSDLLSNANLLEFEACHQGVVPRSSLVGSKNCLKDLQNSLVTSKELLKLLLRLSGIGKQQSSAISLATALYCQLDQALVHIDQLIQEKNSDHNEIRLLMRQFMEEKEAWKSKSQEGIRAAVQSMTEELEMEKRIRRRAEMMNKRLGMELAQMKNSLVKAVKELKSERRTSEIIEQVCSEMIRGIGEDKAEVEELKRESVKVREELEKEREMLQLANEWREERVQMKLSEAKHQFEEKNAAVDQLRYELEAFLAAKRKEELVNGQQNIADNQDSDCRRQMLHPSRSSRVTNVTVDGRDDGGEKDREDDDGTDSEDSDLHSIELNINNGCSWSHASGATEDEAKLASLKEKHERSAKCEMSSGSEFSSDKEMTKEIKGNFNRNFWHLDGNLDEGRPVGDSSLIDNAQRLDETGERCISVEGVRNQNSAGARIVLPRGLLSSTSQWIRQQALKNKGNQVCVGSKVAEMVKAIRESESKASLVRKNKVHSQLQTAPIE